MQSPNNQNSTFDTAVDSYSDMIVRIAFGYTKNRSDSEDIAQEVFLALYCHKGILSAEHLKAWLIRVTINKSKNFVKRSRRRLIVPYEDYEYRLTGTDCEVIQELDRLKAKDRDVLYLFYYEGYSAGEIAYILGKKENAVFASLSRARGRLKNLLKENI